ncbi:hypothetical protein [Psychroserpens algicola]|uniref:Outer membrane lipoprotein-sorting protein n=1 Tax=Psychroserpens algicola TaxID=1719034 RepID=A0ABT0HAR4_9FLAO|nr:hypothetical protein [Psychroserpens algicola]MCK8481272.1 hypothetical protein [Psychroserpens algicola]
MTRLLTFLLVITVLISCKPESKAQNHTTETISEEQIEITVAEKIAQAHGYDHWNNVNTIEFTFNVDRGDNHFQRSWEWQPKADYVVSMVSKDSISMYTRQTPSNTIETIDPKFINVDKSFINDKFWLLIPFQMVWDDGTTLSESIKAVAPIAKTEMNKITLTYSNEGGYTPGDAYDIFYDEDFIIREWVFRKGNSETPTMTTTFENYEDFNGIKIAKDHKMADGNFNLYFSNIKIQ